MRRTIFIISCTFLLACNNKKDKTNQSQQVETMKDTLSGLYSAKYPSGEIKETGMLIGGRKNGIWKKYHENGDLVSVVYFYRNEKITDIDKEDFIFLEVLSDEVSINLPSKWIVKKKYKQALILAVKPMSSDTIFAPTINILREEMPSGIDFPRFIMANKEDLASAYEEIKFRREREYKIAGNKAYEIFYHVKTDGKKLGVITTYILNGHNCYIITCIAGGKGEEFVKYNDLFKEITNSTRFINSQAN
ncbi:MAG: hypothetical protein H6605_03730 [Flavobacteriales bacterium]|nr:hypothetical protein [Flavobacteriales bacterium]